MVCFRVFRWKHRTQKNPGGPWMNKGKLHPDAYLSSGSQQGPRSCEVAKLSHHACHLPYRFILFYFIFFCKWRTSDLWFAKKAPFFLYFSCRPVYFYFCHRHLFFIALYFFVCAKDQYRILVKDYAHFMQLIKKKKKRSWKLESGSSVRLWWDMGSVLT